MWEKDYRDRLWDRLDEDWDVIIVGGGITGAGVLREAGLLGLKALLLEAHDFSSGTSSRSSKLIHGGFRYLRNRQWDITHESVREREWLLESAPNLVTRLSFLLPGFAGAHTPGWEFGLGVVIYDLMAPKWQHRRLSRADILSQAPSLRSEGLEGGYLYYDAEMDDSRLVLRIIGEAVQSGAVAMNYARVDGLLRKQDGRVCGVRVSDTTGMQMRQKEVRARVVINATGPWSDDLREQVGGQPRLRRCRGSHLVFPRDKFPLRAAVTLMHPRDNRAMFAIPWEGVTMIGTTDLDQEEEWRGGEPYASEDEIEYILAALQDTFPGLGLGRRDMVSSFAGLRPLIRPQGSADPSAVSRRHEVWDESGLVTITGGKLTTFRIMARAALRAARPYLKSEVRLGGRERIFDPLKGIRAGGQVDPATAGYLLGRYGVETPALIEAARSGELEHIGPLQALWGELRWAARQGAAVHLEDILLRRVRLGLLLPGGGQPQMGRIRAIVQSEMGWDDARWSAEEAAYCETWQRYYSPVPLGDKSMRIADFRTAHALL